MSVTTSTVISMTIPLSDGEKSTTRTFSFERPYGAGTSTLTSICASIDESLHAGGLSTFVQPSGWKNSDSIFTVPADKHCEFEITSKTVSDIVYREDEEGKTTATISISPATVPKASIIAGMAENDYFIADISYNGDGNLYAVSDSSEILTAIEGVMLYVAYADKEDESGYPGTVTVYANETAGYTSATATFTITA